MSIPDADRITLAAFIAAIFIHRHAVYFVLLHLLTEWLFIAVDDVLYYNLAAGVCFAFAGASLITISYRLRQALLVIGLLFWLYAVDFYMFPTTETLLYNSFAYIVGAVEIYALLLMLKGGSGGGGFYRMCEHWFFLLRYRILWL